MFAVYDPEKDDRSAALMRSLTMNEHESPHRTCFILVAGVRTVSH